MMRIGNYGVNSRWIYNSAISKIKRNHQVREPACVTDASVGDRRQRGRGSRQQPRPPGRCTRTCFPWPWIPEARGLQSEADCACRACGVRSPLRGARAIFPAPDPSRALSAGTWTRRHSSVPATIQGDSQPSLRQPVPSGDYFSLKHKPTGAGGAWTGW